MTVHFIGLNSRLYPYTRVRCFEFAKILEQKGIPCKVYALSEDYLHNPHERFIDTRDKLKLQVQFKLFKDIFRNLKQGDLLYFQKIHHHVAAPYLYSRLKKIPYIVDYDDWDFDRSPFFNRRIFNRLFFGTSVSSEITPLLFKKARSNIVSSHYLERAVKNYSDRVHYLPTGVNLNLFDTSNFPERERAPVFFWNGDVWGDVILENLLFIFSCLSELVHHPLPWKLQLIVFGSRVSQLKRILQDSYSQLPVELIENVPPGEMPRYYSQASIGLMPLFCGKDNQDWIVSKSPTKLFEYMAMKLIPVCHNKGEPSYIIQHGFNGYLFNNRQECIGILKDLLDNYATQKQISENAYNTVREKYSLDVLGNKLYEIIRKIGT